MVDALSSVAVDTALNRVILVGLVVLPTVVRSSLLGMVDKCIRETKVLLTLASIVLTVVWWFLTGVAVVVVVVDDDDDDVACVESNVGFVVFVCLLRNGVTVGVGVVFTINVVECTANVWIDCVVCVVAVHGVDFVVDDVEFPAIVSETEMQCTADVSLICSERNWVLVEYNNYNF